ncbi:unnamed protein product [Bursaphelenchus xylophilus]|uniref:(pine wood nematode) hypothetical protein n=1 Tax=Bursaphelenchus xylophilus TaxID=6326 RepID=A0A1I7RMU1_BURXY|nr:unnamed protein product [Bursaphelenchus xylophilus]CAG9125470.1 unnamed protein product [Bursaphelenchus xylophilus]
MWLCILVLSFFYYHGNAAIPVLALTDVEIKEVAQKMRDADDERPKFCEFYVDYQRHFDGGESDYAEKSLFKWIRPSVLNWPSFKALLDLVPLFNPQTGIAEVNSPDKQKKQRAFITAVFNSGPFKQLIDVLRKKNHPFAKTVLNQTMHDLWFGLFSRAKGRLDSSAFEHVFIGEAKNGEVSGMHNWAVINKFENDPKSTFNYRGFIIKRATLIDGCPVNVQSYDLSQNGKDFIGTVYPEPGPSAPTCMANFKQRATVSKQG